MGNNNSSQLSPQQPDVTQWTLKQQLPTHRIWSKKYNPHYQIEQYSISFHDQKAFNAQKQLYYLRKQHPQLVAAKYFKYQTQRDMCSTIYKGALYLQKIPLRLSHVKDIPFPDIIHFINQALRGAKILRRQYEPFYVSQDHIGINQQGIVKIWLNKEFQKSFHDEDSCTQQQMVRNILEILQFNADQKLLPEGYILNFFYRQNGKLTFDDAIQRLEEYAKIYYNGQIPEKLQCVNKIGFMQALQNYRKKLQYKNQEFSQGPQHVTLVTEIPYQRAITQFPRQSKNIAYSGISPSQNKYQQDRRVQTLNDQAMQNYDIKPNLITLQQRIQRTKKNRISTQKPTSPNLLKTINFPPLVSQKQPIQIRFKNENLTQQRVNSPVSMYKKDTFSHISSKMKSEKQYSSDLDQIPSIKTYSNAATHTQPNLVYSQRSQFRYVDPKNIQKPNPVEVRKIINVQAPQLAKKQEKTVNLVDKNIQNLSNTNKNTDQRPNLIQKNVVKLHQSIEKPRGQIQQQKRIHSYQSFAKISSYENNAQNFKQHSSLQKNQNQRFQQEQHQKKSKDLKNIETPNYQNRRIATTQFIPMEDNNFLTKISTRQQYSQSYKQTTLNHQKQPLKSYEVSPNRNTVQSELQKSQKSKSYHIEEYAVYNQDVAPVKQQEYQIEWDPQILADLQHLRDDDEKQ